MWDLLELVLDNLEIKSKETVALKNEIKNLRGNQDEAKVVLSRLKAEAKLNNCTTCDSRHFSSFFRVCIYYELGEFVQMQRYAKRAIRDFNLIGAKWNELFAHWVYGESYLLFNRKMPARRKLKYTVEKFERMAKKYRRENQYERRDECYGFIERIEDQLVGDVLNVRDDVNLIFEQKIVHQSPPPFFSSLSRWKRSQLIFPTQSQIRAGAEGDFIFESQPNLDAILEELTFNEIPHQFYNLREEGNPIVLNPRVYRWFRVDGDSMNQATLIPIMNNDYVLAIDLNLSNFGFRFGDIIIAALDNPVQGERAGVIKRYASEGLVSESSNDYEIISLDEVNIRGVVIAVAKPILKSALSNLDDNEHAVAKEVQVDETEEIGVLYEDLLVKVFYDHATVKRLIQYEKKRTPSASPKELLKNAIDRWIRDNR